MSTIHPADNPALFGCAPEHQTGKNAQTVLIGQLRISCCGRNGDQKCLLGRSPSLLRLSANQRRLQSGGEADSAKGRASTLTACGKVSIPGEELHTWSLWPPPPLAPAAPGSSSILHSISISLFLLSSPFSSFPSYTYHYYYYHHYCPDHFLSLFSTQPAAFVLPLPLFF